MPNSAPPIGLTPVYIVRQQRIDDILNVMLRYAIAMAPAKEEWVTELAELIQQERDAK